MDTSTILAGLRAQRDRINQAITALEALDGDAGPTPTAKKTARSSASVTTKKRVISPEGRKRMAEAQRKRWAAKKKSVKLQNTKQAAPRQAAPKNAKGRISAAGRKRISEAAKARWAEKKATAKTS